MKTHPRPSNPLNKKRGPQSAPLLHLTKQTLGETAGRGQSPFEPSCENRTLAYSFISLLTVPKLCITPITLK